MKKYYRLIPSLLVLIVGINISVGIYFKEKDEFLHTKNKELTDIVTIQINAVRKELDETFTSIELLKYLFEMNSEISREEFKNYATSILTINTDIKAISWVPKIEENNRLKFKSKILNEKIIQDFAITERNKQNKLITATIRDLYFAVEYIEPLEENIQALGYNIFSNEKRKLTITNAIDNRNLQITPVIKLVQDTIGNSFLGILPVFDYSKSTKDTINYKNVKGLISTVFKVDQLINNALLDTEGHDIELHIYDITNDLNEKIYSSGNSFDLTHNQKRIITIGGRVWELNFTPKPIFYENKDAYSNLIFGLLITLIVSLLILFYQIKGKKNKKMLLRLEAEKKVRRQAEKSLLKIEEFQANILKTAMDGFWMIDLLGNILEVNDKYCTMSGYSRTELLQMSVSNVEARETALETTQRIQKLKEIGEDRFETQHRRKDGSVFDVEISVQCQLPDSEYMVVFLKDITERKKSEKLLQESEKKFITLYNNSPDMYVSVSPEDAKILECNNTLLEKTNYTRNELIGFPVFKLYHEDCMDGVKRSFQQFVETGKVSDKELIIKTKEGNKINVSLNVNAIKDETGKILYSISSWRDISETKKDKEEIEENANFIESIINASPDIIYIYDIQEQKNVFSNNGIHFNLGYTIDEIKEIGNQVLPILMHPDDFDIYLQNIVPKYSTLDDKEILSHEYRMKDKAGNWRWLHSKESIFLRTPDGEPKQIFGISNDITEQKKATETIEKNSKLLTLFVEHSPASIAMFDNEMKYIVASNRYKIDYDLGSINLTGRSHYKIFPEIPQQWKEIHQKCLAGETIKSDEDQFLRVDGKLDWVKWEMRPWYENNNIIGGIILFSEVITERKKIELELQKHQAHLEELVKERTQELEEKNKKLDRMNQLFVGRELRMKELKEEIEKLKKNN